MTCLRTTWRCFFRFWVVTVNMSWFFFQKCFKIWSERFYLVVDEAFLTAEKLRPIDHKPLSHLDNDLDDLLVQRLRHSQIRISKLRELQAGFSVQDYPRTKATVEMALKDFKVMPLTTLARWGVIICLFALVIFDNPDVGRIIIGTPE